MRRQNHLAVCIIIRDCSQFLTIPSCPCEDEGLSSCHTPYFTIICCFNFSVQFTESDTDLVCVKEQIENYYFC